MPDSYHDYARITGPASDSTVAISNLVAWYELNEGSGSTAYDSADDGSIYGDDTAQDGTINGASWTTTAKTGGQALDFDGTDDYVNCASQHIVGSGPLTVVGWIDRKTSDLGSIYGQADDNENDISLWLYLNTSNNPVFRYSDSNNNNIRATGTSNLNTNTYYHMARVMDSNGDIEVYLNATSESTETGGNGVVQEFTSPRSDMGALMRSDTEYREQILDDVRVYNKALSQSEIQDIYDNTK